MTTTPPDRQASVDISEEAVEKLLGRNVDEWRDPHRANSYRAEADAMLRALRTALTARDDALASIRVFTQDCIENGYFDKGALGNLYAIRDLCDRIAKGETKAPQDWEAPPTKDLAGDNDYD